MLSRLGPTGRRTSRRRATPLPGFQRRDAANQRSDWVPNRDHLNHGDEPRRQLFRHFGPGDPEINQLPFVGGGSGTLTITKVVTQIKLTVTALDQNRTYGEINPAFAYTITGFANGDFLDQSELSGCPTYDHCRGTGHRQTPVGVYTITIVYAGTPDLQRPQLHAR